MRLKKEAPEPSRLKAAPRLSADLADDAGADTSRAGREIAAQLRDYAPDGLLALNATSRSIVITDASQADDPIAYANAAFSSLTGYSSAEVVGRNCRFLQGRDTDPRAVAEIRAAVEAGVGIQREVLNYRKDGTSFWNDVTIDPVHDAAGRLTGFISIQSEADAVHLANEARAEAESRLDSIASHVPGYIYRRVMDTEGIIRLEYCSPSVSRLIGVYGADVADRFFSHVHPDDQDTVIAAIRSSAADMSLFREEFRLVSADGTAHWIRSDAPPRRMPNGEIVWDGLAIEISAEKRWQREIADLALRDPLTGLLTREAWRQALAMQLTTSGDDAQQCGVLYAGIDAFRDLNDKLGQRVCDDILRRIAQRLAATATSFAGVAGRLGGDEFAILVPRCAGRDAMSEIASALCVALARPIEISAQLLTVPTSVGAALAAELGTAPTAEDAASELMTRAEFALRWAKQAGTGSHATYSAERDDRFQNQAILGRSLERAIRDDELELHYQPLVELASGRIVSAEALVRWNHPTLGMQRPDLFIPMAEKSGLILPLGRWVIDRVMRQRSMWEVAGLSPPPIAINVSGAQLVDTGFVPFVAAALKSMRSSAGNFEFELTEGQLIEASPQVMTSLNALRDMGIKIAIDDFGSGHATFRYLRDFPVDKLKIDQLFVRKLVLDSSDALIIRAIIALARSMGIQVVAEGIETDMQREFLQREGCGIGQGYLFSIPLVAEDFAWLLAGDVRLPLPVPNHEVRAGRHPVRPSRRSI